MTSGKNPRGFAEFACENPRALALTLASGPSWTRGELFRAVNRIAHALRANGLYAGDCIAIMSPNCMEFIVTHLAAMEIGVYVVPINWHLVAPEVNYVLSNANARFVFVHPRVEALAVKAVEAQDTWPKRRVISFGASERFSSLESFVAGHSEERVPDPTLGRVLMYTSATTGRPKAIRVPLTDAAQALQRTIGFYNRCGIFAEDGNVHLCASMLYHAAPLDCLYMALTMGHAAVMVDQWDPEQLLKLIHQHRVTTSFMVPAMFVRLLKLPVQVRQAYDVSSLRLVAHSAAPCSVEAKKTMLEWWGPVLWESYGAAEGAGTVASPEEWLRKPGTVGKAMPGTILRVLDDDGTELPARSPGLIYFSRFTGDLFEYAGDPEKTRAAYRGDLFTVGDVGYLDEDGYLYICDRKVDMVISGGVNIYPAEVEQTLLQHPNVADCAVFGVPDELMGEAVYAVVQPCEGVVPDAKLSGSLLAYLRERISPTKLPRMIEYSHALPRDPNGKLYKRLLREPFWAGRARKI